MKTRQIVFSLVGIVGLLIAFEVGRHLQAISSTTRSPNDRLVTISASPAPETGCEVDFPVVFLRQQRHRVQWQSQDKPYWISFLKLDEVIPGYTPENTRHCLPIASHQGSAGIGVFHSFLLQR